MRELITYIKEGFYKNAGTENYTKFINSLPDKLYNYNTLRQIRGANNAFAIKIKNIDIWEELYELFSTLPSFKVSYENIFTIKHSFDEPDTSHQCFTFVKDKDHFYYTCEINYEVKTSLNTKGDFREMKNTEELLRFFLYFLKFMGGAPSNIIEQAKKTFKFEIMN